MVSTDAPTTDEFGTCHPVKPTRFRTPQRKAQTMETDEHAPRPTLTESVEMTPARVLAAGLKPIMLSVIRRTQVH